MQTGTGKRKNKTKSLTIGGVRARPSFNAAPGSRYANAAKAMRLPVAISRVDFAD